MQVLFPQCYDAKVSKSLFLVNSRNDAPKSTKYPHIFNNRQHINHESSREFALVLESMFCSPVDSLLISFTCPNRLS